MTQLRPDAYVEHVDILKLTNPLFRRCYGKGYFDVVNVAPELVRFLYNQTDKPDSGHWWSAAEFRKFVGRLNMGRYIDLLTTQHWDVVINTHFLPPEIISYLRRHGQVHFPQVTVVTDFDVHRLWIHSPCDHYFTATPEGRVNIAATGVPPENITVVGIPIDPVFRTKKTRSDCRNLHGITSDRPVVLQMAGGQGFGPTEAVHHGLLSCEVPLEIIATAGRNEKLQKRLGDIPCPDRHRRTVLGFTSKMDELMLAADIVITKPGGLTTSESLARGLAMMVIDPIPGQEERNCDFLLENGVAVKVNNFASLAHKLAGILNDPGRLESMRRASARLGKPEAAFDIARAVLRLINASPTAEAASADRAASLQNV